MSATGVPIKIGYFGKIPTRGDFVKSADNTALITLVDDWLAQTMELLSRDARWKIIYDSVKPLHFVIMGPRSHRALAGHLHASSDQSQRRFPFISMSAFDIENPVAFVGNGPLILSRLWSRLDLLTADVLAARDPGPSLLHFGSSTLELDINCTGYSGAFIDFLELHSTGSLQQMLTEAGFTGNLRQLLLALGLLLQPVMASRSSRLDKNLILPLPCDPIYRSLVASFWMQLITPFLRSADFELALFLPRQDERPCMFLGFSGSSPRTLHSVMDTNAGAERNIAFDDADWVEERAGSGHNIQKLSSYLSHLDLSLKSVIGSFHEAFIGV